MHKTNGDHLHQKWLFRPEDKRNYPSRTNSAVSKVNSAANRSSFRLEAVLVKSIPQDRWKQRTDRASRRKLWQRVIAWSPLSKVIFKAGSNSWLRRGWHARFEQWFRKRICASSPARQLNSERWTIFTRQRTSNRKPATEAIAHGCLKRALELKAGFKWAAAAKYKRAFARAWTKIRRTSDRSDETWAFELRKERQKSTWDSSV